MIESQYEKLPLKSITKHVQRFNKAQRAKNKLRKEFIRESENEIYIAPIRFLKDRLNKEIKSKYKLKKQRDKEQRDKDRLRKKFIRKSKDEIAIAPIRFLKDKVNREIINVFKLKNQREIKDELGKLRLSRLANNNITEHNLINIKKYAELPIKTLRQIAKLRNINENVSKSDIIYALIRSEPIVDEQKYLFNGDNGLVDKMNEVRLMIIKASGYIDKEKAKTIRKKLYDVQNMQKIDRKTKNKLLKELESIFIDLKFIEKHMVSDFRDDNYANIADIVYMFGDINDDYKSILVNTVFDGGYQRYHIRGDKNRDMTIEQYYNATSPHLKVLIDNHKVHETKIQIDMGFNMVHLDNNRRITHFSRSENVICTPSSNTNEILGLLLTSLHEKMINDIELSRENSSYVFESIEECNIHFHKIDLRRGSSFIEQPAWLKNKKATINPQNNDIYCFMYAVSIALYSKELETKNPGRISKKYVCMLTIFYGAM